MDRKYACAGDTVDVNIWTWAIGFNEEQYTDPVAAPHVSDIYITPTTNVKVYSTEKSFKSNDVFQANFSKSSGQIILLYLYQIESLVYEVTGSSRNAIATDGELLIFHDHDDYYYYVNVPDNDYLASFTVLYTNFSNWSKQHSRFDSYNIQPEFYSTFLLLCGLHNTSKHTDLLSCYI